MEAAESCDRGDTELPEIALADVLRRLAPRDLAASRCVRKAWRDIIDGHKMLLPHRLPLSVGGIFINFNNLDSPEFLARPTTGPKVSGNQLLDFLPYEPMAPFLLQDHCNGLLLLNRHVVNPATGTWDQLPPHPVPRLARRDYFEHDEYLVFDPMVSPHYEVFAVPRIMEKKSPRDCGYDSSQVNSFDPTIEKSEWPPSQWIICIFSSRTGQWEERSFSREGDAIKTVADMRSRLCLGSEEHYAAYWQGDLYVHHDANFVIRLCLSDNKYQVIKPPIRIPESMSLKLYLGKSEKGVYCALLGYWSNARRLWVWILQEVCGKMKWVIKDNTDLDLLLKHRRYDEDIDGPWILQDINYYAELDEDDDGKAIASAEFEWDSDDDNVLEIGDRVHDFYRHYSFLGFHPYKEVLFLCESRRRGLAYHLNSSKVQDLGNLRPTNYIAKAGHHAHIINSFPYTPCWMEEYPL